MLDDLENRAEIVKLTDRLLRQADAYGQLPTPVSSIVAAAGLIDAPDSFLADASIAEAPPHLRGILRRIKGKVYAALDRKTREVHINPATDHATQRAFKRLHETSHALFPWQHIGEGESGFADDAYTLSPRTTALFEQEANQGAAELLFQRNRFAEMAADYEIGCATISELADLFGASRHAAFRRYVETHRGALAGVVLETRPHLGEPLAFRRCEAFCSASWTERFEPPQAWPRVLHREPFTFVEQAHACGSIGSSQGAWSYIDRENRTVTLQVDAMSNTYRTFVLAWLPRREILKRRRFLSAVV